MTTPTPATEPLLIDAKRAAAMLSIGQRLLSKLTASGELPSVKIAARRLYSLDDLRIFIDGKRGER